MKDGTISKIVKWLKHSLAEAKAKGFVLGLSGGVDSAVCAALIKKASRNSLGLILPIESDVQDIDDAAAIAQLLNLKTEYIDLTGVYHNLSKLVPRGNRVVLGNIKARLRMVVLYYYANLSDYLVCGTGNKTEIALGYFTKFGDGGCDMLPLGDLYKCEVRALAKQLRIPEKIIKKIPSAGLWKGQTDEGEIGCKYREMDETLQTLEKGIIKGKIAKRLTAMIQRSAHKRRMPRICFITKKKSN